MIMRDARKAIHDSFALHVKSSDWITVGDSTEFDSDTAIFNSMKAGMIIRAVMEQRPAERGCALFLNAHDGVINDQEIAALKLKLWMDFVRSNQLDARAQAEVFCIADKLIQGYKHRVWDYQSNRLPVSVIAKHVSSNSKIHSRVVQNSHAFLDQLTRLDNRSLQPVWKVINEQKEKREQQYEETNAKSA